MGERSTAAAGNGEQYCSTSLEGGYIRTEATDEWNAVGQLRHSLLLRHESVIGQLWSVGTQWVGGTVVSDEAPHFTGKQHAVALSEGVRRATKGFLNQRLDGRDKPEFRRFCLSFMLA